jgi:hypothetical protein
MLSKLFCSAEVSSRRDSSAQGADGAIVYDVDRNLHGVSLLATMMNTLPSIDPLRDRAEMQ